MTLVKVCGLTREEDVRRAARLGAGACGFILTSSKRRITAERARSLAALSGDALTVAVVTREPAEWIAAQLAESGLSAVQLSAGADGPTVAQVRDAAARRGLQPQIIAAADTPDVDDADMILYDARCGEAYGGTGLTLPWASMTGGPLPPRDRLVLAGGLTPGNVDEAIRTLHPCMVDVGSGVEVAPGIKDDARLEAFIAAVAQADRHSPGDRDSLHNRPSRVLSDDRDRRSKQSDADQGDIS